MQWISISSGSSNPIVMMVMSGKAMTGLRQAVEVFLEIKGRGTAITWIDNTDVSSEGFVFLQSTMSKDSSLNSDHIR